jgi:hypothetical protein
VEIKQKKSGAPLAHNRKKLLKFTKTRARVPSACHALILPLTKVQ